MRARELRQAAREERREGETGFGVSTDRSVISGEQNQKNIVPNLAILYLVVIDTASGVYESPSVKKDLSSRPMDLHGRHGKSCGALFLEPAGGSSVAWARAPTGSRLESGEVGRCMLS